MSTETNNSTKHVLADYIKTKNPKYALLIDAPWGAGKTHFIKKETNYEADNTILYISLNGVTNTEEFEWAIVRAIKPFSDETSGKWGIQLKNLASGIQILGCSIDLNKVSITELILSNIPDILIFDDLERCLMKHDQLSGLLNHFIEHQNKRVILIANSLSHNEKKNFDTKKEKIIGRTVTIEADAEAALLAYWPEIQNSKAKTFLKSITSEILSVFYEANNNNLRILKQSILETHDFINKIDKNLLKNIEALTSITITYFALAIAFRNGELTINDLHKRGDYSVFVKNENNTSSNLKSVQARHQKCDIQGYHNSCLPVSLAINSIGKGFVSKKQIKEELENTYRFAKPELTPDWIRLWNWCDEDLDDLTDLLKRIDKKLQSNEIIPAGEVLQIYGAKSFLAKMGGINNTQIELKDQFIKIIKQLEKKKLITPYEPISSLRGGYGYSTDVGTISYGGYAFEITETSKIVLGVMQEAQKRLFKNQLQSYSKSLMSDLQETPSKFIQALRYNSKARSFSQTPILHLISANKFACELIKLFLEDRETSKEVCSSLQERRAPHNKELKAEHSWFDKLESELLKQAEKHSDLFKAQVSLLISRYLKYR